MVSRLYLRLCTALQAEKEHHTHRLRGSGDILDGTVVVLAVPLADAIVAAHEENTDATRANLGEQVAHVGASLSGSTSRCRRMAC